MKLLVSGSLGAASGFLSVFSVIPLGGLGLWLPGLWFGLAALLIIKFRNASWVALWLLACSAGYALAFFIALTIAGRGIDTALAPWLAFVTAGVVGALPTILILGAHSHFSHERDFWLTLLLSGVLGLPGVAGIKAFENSSFLDLFTPNVIPFLPLFIIWQAGMLMWYASRPSKETT